MTITTDAPTDPVAVLDLARSMRMRGELPAAGALLDAALSQTVVQAPATAELAAQTGWLLLERASLELATGSLLHADQRALDAVKVFERAGDRAGQAAASLLLGDASWHGGHSERAVTWWHRARALAEGAGNSALAARALASIAMSELRAGTLAAVEGLVGQAEQATLDPVAEALEDGEPGTVAALRQEAARQQDDAARAVVALVRARASLRSGRTEEARLLLAAAAELAASLSMPDLQIDALRMDAAVSRRDGDPRAAVEALRIARATATKAGLPVQVALLDADLVLALADNGDWQAAFAVQEQAPTPAIAALPVVAAARLEAFALLAQRAQNLAGASRALQEAAAIREARGDAAGLAAIVAQQAAVALDAGELQTAAVLAERAAEQGRTHGRLDAAIGAEMTWLRCRLRSAQVDATTLAAAALLCEGADAVGTVGQRVVAHDLHAAVLAEHGDLAGAQAACDRSIALASRQPLLRLRARAQTRAGALKLLAGDARGAMELAQSSAEQARLAEDRQAHAAAMQTAGEALRALGRHDESLLALGHATSEAALAGRKDIAAQAGWRLGDGYLAVGRHRQARHSLEVALAQATGCQMNALAARIRRGIASTYAAGGEADLARATLEELVQGAPLQEAAGAQVDLARQALRGGDREAALAWLQTAPPSGSSRHDEAEWHVVAGEAAARAGELDNAAQHLEEAVAMHRQGDPRALGAALFLQGQVHGMRGEGQACGAALGEALVITARLGLPEQDVVRRAIERLQAQSEGA